jgi:hypothetical protein
MNQRLNTALGAIATGAGLVVMPAIAAEVPQLLAQADEVLTSASIYRLQNQVQLRPRNQSARAAQLNDVLVPLDAVQTGANSIAELLFNEGSIARVDANTVFRFQQGLRRFQLPNRISAVESGPDLASLLPGSDSKTFTSPTTDTFGSPAMFATVFAAARVKGDESATLAQTPLPTSPSAPPEAPEGAETSPASDTSAPDTSTPGTSGSDPALSPDPPPGASPTNESPTNLEPSEPAPSSAEMGEDEEVPAESESPETSENGEDPEEEVKAGISETIFVLESGTALVISPPEGIGTQIRTPQSRVNIVASVLPTLSEEAPTEAALPGFFRNFLATSWPVPFFTSRKATLNFPLPLAQTETPQDVELLPPPDRSSAAMAVHDPGTDTTQVFALTDGDITVSNLTGTETVPLLGGQTVFVNEGQLSDVQEFDLNTFYQTVPLAAGLGPGQEGVVAQQPPAVQVTLLAVRPATLAAVSNQARRLDGFSNTFLSDALSGTDSSFDGNEARSPLIIIDPQSIDGTFVRTGDTTAEFISNQLPAPVLIDVNIDNRTIRINGQTGISNDAGLSGNSASGTVIFENGEAIRVEVFDVGGDYENIDIGDTRPGRLTTGIAPDR